MKPLTHLISERSFDDYQPGLTSRFSAYSLQYQLTYCQQTDNSAMRLDFESSLHIGRITVWESGACEIEVIDITTEQTVLAEHRQLNSEREFHSVLAKTVVFMRDALSFL